MNAYQDWVLKIREGKVGCANPIHKKTTTDDDSEFLTCAVAEMDGFLDNVTPQKSNKRKRGIQRNKRCVDWWSEVGDTVGFVVARQMNPDPRVLDPDFAK
ncbi:hypothetical protein PS2_025442 [Malus domestica]